MTRRKSMVPRYPNGQPRRPSQLQSPNEVKRLQVAALAGMRPAEWGTSLGRLFLNEQITPTQYSAGKRFAELSAKYSVACGGPAPARSAKLDPDGGTTADPDSPTGLREGRRHRQTVEGYLTASKVLRGMGKAAEAAVTDVCVKDLHPVGLIHLRGGLSALAALWGSRS